MKADTRLPWLALLALSLTAFLTILTEALPAGLLPWMAEGLGVSQALAGQCVTIYALGSLLAAVPLTAATRRVARRRVLLGTLAGFAAANGVTALSGDYELVLAARCVAGLAAGLLWSLLAGYAARLVPAQQVGRAIAVAMAGTPLALSLGVPAAALLGAMAGWRPCFALMCLLAVLLMVWVRLAVPDFPGETAKAGDSMASALRRPGIMRVLLLVLVFVLAHNLLYTYIAPLLEAAGQAAHMDAVLLVFGLASLLSIAVAGAWVDTRMRGLALASTLLFLLAAVGMALFSACVWLIWPVVAGWGLAFGGAATVFQTALARVAGEAADAAQSMLVTAWNAAIAGGGLLGGLLLKHLGVTALGPAALPLLLMAWWLVRAGGRDAFPRC